MLKIEEYIKDFKIKNKINEFDLANVKANKDLLIECITFYFDEYINETELEKTKRIHSEKVEKYRKQMKKYDKEIIDWAVQIYDKNQKSIDRYILSIVNNERLFLLFSTEKEFENLSIQVCRELTKKLPDISLDKTDIYKFLINYHKIKSEFYKSINEISISAPVDNWINETFNNFNVNLVAFAEEWLSYYFNHPNIWPHSHKILTDDKYFPFQYDYKKEDILFNIDWICSEQKGKEFLISNESLIEELFIYVWVHRIEGEEIYWKEYYKKKYN
ncbi:hypothetical protein KFV08_02640 [Macrococcoides canis]|uniref:hypothetical protein n=1 Tax=Macrococcoides canis TaxID=1855823 RepID=UPI00207C2AEE|nr:hypothetical protein [Macrococcus canis]MCO4097050.1 hypothetical protein [Macrococcus canis]UTH09692.1 hypothetical protein KFV08_02640 [Macrococcus canis]